jgi:hypothetical protein
VTIAAGFICADGAVLAADTKETYGETHTYINKVSVIDEDHCCAAIASSGNNGYLLDYLTPYILELLKNSQVLTSSIFEVRLQTMMAKLYQTPEIKAFPIEKPEDLYTQFLIIAKHAPEQECSMFIINTTLVTRVSTFASVIGCGPMTEMGQELGLVSAPGIEKACNAALYVVHEAKRRYSDVGGTTTIVSIDNRGELNFPASHQAESEELINQLRHLNNILVVSLLDPMLTKEKLTTLLHQTSGRLREIHKEASAIHKRKRERFRKHLRKKVRQSTSRKSKRVQ